MISLQGDCRTGCHDLASWEAPSDDYFAGFYHPEYFIGQIVLHKMRTYKGEILHSVVVIGLYWTGLDWEYEVLLPPDHPQFVPEDNAAIFLSNWNLEPI